MKTGFKVYLFFAVTLVAISCGGEDDSMPVMVETSGEVLLDENPALGVAIDTLSNRIQGAGDFSLAIESHKDAFAIDAVSGIISVNNPLIFDFETNPLITAVISYQLNGENREFELRVRLENKDDILHFLTTSQGLYELAAAGEWIKVTEVEYETLAENLVEIAACGTTKEQYDQSFPDLPDELHQGSFTIANNNGATIPEGAYLFAFKYSFNPHVTKINIDDSQLKISTDAIDQGYEDFGPPLPLHTFDDAFFLLKGNDNPIAREGFLGMYKDTYVWTNSQLITEEYYYGTGNVTELDGFVRNQKSFKYQGLATTVKQWD
ncbi:hypothetical protein [Poritiphilus flavus]|nr:hypothetical protein [Poritiphilus flavus]